MSGVSAFHSAKIDAVDSEDNDALDAMITCSQYAVVAFWDLSEWSDIFKCYRFFFVPNPFKRIIKESEKA